MARGLRPTMRDVAHRAGVSSATVSNVLGARRNVNSEIARRVNDAVAQLGYRVDAVAANLRRAQRSLVGLVIPDFQNPFFGELVSHLERHADAAGYRLAVVSSREDAGVEAAEIRTLVDWRVAGLIVVPVGGPFRSRAVIREADLPTVIVDRAVKREGFDAVAVDNAAIAGAALRHLHAAGHRRILVAASMDSVPNMRERVQGAIAAAQALGIADSVEVLFCGADSATSAATMLGRFESAPLPTAVLTLYNLATLATLQAAHRFQLAIPRDLSMVGFDDYAWMEVANPPVTAVAQPVAAMAEAAWDRLLQRLRGAAAPKRTIRVACTLVERDSVAPPGTVPNGFMLTETRP